MHGVVLRAMEQPLLMLLLVLWLLLGGGLLLLLMLRLQLLATAVTMVRNSAVCCVGRRCSWCLRSLAAAAVQLSCCASCWFVHHEQRGVVAEHSPSALQRL